MTHIEQLILKIQSLMIAYVTDQRSPYQPNRYRELYEALDRLLSQSGRANPNSHPSLEEFASYCRLRGLDHYSQRTEYVRELYSSAVSESEVEATEREAHGDDTRIASTSQSAPKEKEIDPRRVFVVHGRNNKINEVLYSLLRALDLRPIEWSEAVATTGEGSPYIGDVLTTAFASAQAVVVLMTPDDLVMLRESLRRPDDNETESQLVGQARPNVLFEAGMAFGRNPRRTVIVEIGSPKSFSDIHGRHVVRLTNSVESRRELANRLERAGCPVDLTGTSWMSVGDFNINENEDYLSEDIEEDTQTQLILSAQATQQVRELVVRYRAERDSEPLNLDQAQDIVGEALSLVHHFMAQIDEDQVPDIYAKFGSVSAQLSELKQHELLVDGGKSYTAFWKKADSAFAALKELTTLVNPAG